MPLKPIRNNSNPIEFKKELEILGETTFSQYNNDYQIPFKKEPEILKETAISQYNKSYHIPFKKEQVILDLESRSNQNVSRFSEAPITKSIVNEIVPETTLSTSIIRKKPELSEFFKNTRIPAEYFQDDKLSNSDVEEYFLYDASYYDGFSLMEDPPVRNFNKNRVSFESYIKKELNLNEFEPPGYHDLTSQNNQKETGKMYNQEENNEMIDEEIEEQPQLPGNTCRLSVKHYSPYRIPISIMKEFMEEMFSPLMGNLVGNTVIFRNSKYDPALMRFIDRENLIFKFERIALKQDIQNKIDDLKQRDLARLLGVKVHIEIWRRTSYNKGVAARKRRNENRKHLQN